MKTKLFTMMSVIAAFLMMLPAAVNAENPAGRVAPQTINLQCSTSNATVRERWVMGKLKFEHKAQVSITTGQFGVPAGRIIKYSVNGYPPKSFTVTGEIGIPPFSKQFLGTYYIVLDEKETWPEGCSAFYTN